MDIRTTAGINVTAGSIQPEKSAARVAESVRAETVAQAAPAAQQDSKPDDTQLDNAVQNINSVLSVRTQSLEFKVDEDNRTIVTVIDKETQEVIRQMPSREALEIAKALDRLQSLLSKQTA
ncbi:flagellar protein FlaG [Pseudoduganella sp. GCM10020061]|uniref:flagellar protein FlaG n=1 Tax=Pseudoduganella sp. GCM10020061 TaxID=3317345 RepID=UPI0036301113